MSDHFENPESTSHITTQGEVLAQFCVNRQQAHEGAVRGNDNSWRAIYYEINAATNYGMLVIVLIQTVALFFIAKYGAPKWWLGLAVVPIVVWNLVSLTGTIMFKWSLTFGPNALDENTSNLASRLEKSNSDNSILFRFWRRCFLIAPLTYRHIWWWTLVFSFAIAGAEFDAAKPTAFNDLLISLLKGIIISAISYIASNIIRELVSLRQGYDRTSQEVQRTAKLAGDAAFTLGEFQKLAADTRHDVKIAIGYANLGILLQTLKIKSSGGTQLKAQSDRFLDNVQGYVATFLKQIDRPSSSLQLMVTALMNLYLENEKRVLNTTQKHIITRFEVLGKSVGEIVKTVTSWSETENQARASIEYHALLVMPPDQFLQGPEKNSTDDKDNRWDSYLESNHEAAMKKVKQFRHFLSIPNAESWGRTNGESVSPPDLSHLDSIKVWRSCLDQVAVTEAGDPKVEWSPHRFSIAPSFPKEVTHRSVAEVIAKFYHTDGCCFVRELSYQNAMEQRLVHERTLRPYDYFAVREDDKWVLCLQSIYDERIDVVDIELFFEGMQMVDDQTEARLLEAQWAEVCRRLDSLFLNKGSKEIGKRIPIESYAANSGVNTASPAI